MRVRKNVQNAKCHGSGFGLSRAGMAKQSWTSYIVERVPPVTVPIKTGAGQPKK